MPNLSDYGRHLLGKRCDCNGHPSLAGIPIDHYDHVGGWKVGGIEDRVWLSVECPKCRYGWSLTKLGIPGKATFDEQLQEEIRVYGHVRSFTAEYTSRELQARLLAKR